jgi:hypothetical protein
MRAGHETLCFNLPKAMRWFHRMVGAPGQSSGLGRSVKKHAAKLLLQFSRD